MKVTVATSKSDLSLLTKLDEPIVVYANDKTIYHKISKIRNSIEHITIVIYDKDRKTPNQVILEHRDRLKTHGITSLEAFDLKEIEDYTVSIFIGALLLFILLIVIYTLYAKNYKYTI